MIGGAKRRLSFIGLTQNDLQPALHRKGNS